MANPEIVTGPTVEPITVPEAKAQLRIDFSTDDTLIESLIVSAREGVEAFCGAWLIQRTARYWLRSFPRCSFIELPGGVLQSVTSVKYYTSSSAEETLASESYFVAKKRFPGAVALAYDYQWPTDTLRPDEAVAVEYVAGYGATPATIPQDLKHAVLLYVTHLYVNRGDSSVPMPEAIKTLCWPHRIVAV